MGGVGELHPEVPDLDVAENYGTEDCNYEPSVVGAWREVLCKLWGAGKR